MAERFTSHGKQVLRDGEHFADAVSVDDAKLIVTDVRFQLLQQIGEEDAGEEGTSWCECCGSSGWVNSGPDGGWQCREPGCGDGTLVDDFRSVWTGLHTKKGERWDDNPEVVALTFRVERANIDRIPA